MMETNIGYTTTTKPLSGRGITSLYHCAFSSSITVNKLCAVPLICKVSVVQTQYSPLLETGITIDYVKAKAVAEKSKARMMSLLRIPDESDPPTNLDID